MTTSTGYTDRSSERVKGKRVLVTGGTTGIGRATAHALLREGAMVMICGRHQSELDDALEDAPGPGKLTGTIADLAKITEVVRLFQEVDDQFGTIDILVNNAAVASQGAAEISVEEIDYTVRANLAAYLTCAHEAAVRMRNNANGGFIVNIGSMSADVREKGSSVYVATKAGIQGFSEAFRKEVNEQGIAVSLIEPGATGSDMQEADPARERELQAAGKMLTADDVAQAVMFCLKQPPRVNIVELRLRPHRQII